jgi:hypothetical protein
MKITFKIFALLVINLLVFELLCTVLVNFGIANTSLPTYELQKRRFFGDYNSEFGSWHIPSSSYRHKTKCFDATYRFNSLGAKDKEFNNLNSQNNVFLIGDSMAEGYGLSNSESLDSQLESITKLNILNFGTSGHFGTTQYSLLYDHFSKSIKHKQLIVLLTLQNDFLDDSFKFGQQVFHNRYRPYRVYDANMEGNYSLIYFQNKKLETGELEPKDIFSAYLASYHVAKSIYKTFKSIMYKVGVYDTIDHPLYDTIDHPSAESTSQTKLLDNTLNTFVQKGLDLMVHNLNLMSVKALNNNVDLLIVVTPNSSEVFSGIQKPETKKVISELSRRVSDAQIIDPFKNFKDHDNSKSLFHSCDAHISPKGSKELAKIISKYLL